MNEIPWAIVTPILVLQLILMAAALISCLRAERTNGPKWLWILIILFVSIFGPVAFFVAGRREL
ncbi:MAG: transcriptional regulator [Paenibacillaceae bacterium]|nr:transcriptional regulator [Paenibacillaceae bacterium]